MPEESTSSFFHELKRRNVFRTGAAYLVIAWLLAQVADLILGAFDAPDWILRLIIIAMATGFPVALILAWVYEITNEGVIRTERVAVPDAISLHKARQVDFAIIGVLVVAVALFAAERFRLIELGSGPVVDRHSIAVLPFVNRSASVDDIYFVDGIHDDLLSKLSKVRDLLVISRTSVMQYRNTTKPIPEIGDELGVSVVLEGGVQRAGGQVRINVQLIDVATDEHIWAETFDRQLNTDNIFAIQSEISETIVAQLAAALTPEERQRIERQPTHNLEAYNAVLLGDQRRSLLTVDGRAQAETYYRRAIELDPRYSMAWERLAHILLSQWRNDERPDEAMLEAGSAIERSIELDEQNGRAWLRKGEIEQEFSMAGHANFSDLEIDAMFERAMDLLPNDGDLYARYAVFVSWKTRMSRDQDQINALLRKAVLLDPLSVELRIRLADELRKTRRFDEAQQMLARARELQPDNPLAYWHSGQTYWDAGALADGIVWMAKALQFEQNDPSGQFTIALAAFDLGDPELVEYWYSEGLRIGSDHPMASYVEPVMFFVRGDMAGLEELAARKLASGSRVAGSTTYRRILRDRDLDNGQPELALERYRTQVPALFQDDLDLERVRPNEIVNFAFLLQQLGRHEKATELLQDLLAIFNRESAAIDFIDSRFELRKAEVLCLLGRIDEAAKILDQVARTDWPRHWPAIRTNRTLEPLHVLAEYQDMEQRIEAIRTAQRRRYAQLIAEDDRHSSNASN